MLPQGRNGPQRQAGADRTMEWFVRRMALVGVVVGALIGGVAAWAQTPGPSGNLRTAQLPSGPRTFESLVVRGPDGKVVLLEGNLDLIALRRNPLVDQATRQRITPYIHRWFGEARRIIADNLDFVEEIEPPDGRPGLLVDFNPQDPDQARYVAQIMTQLVHAHKSLGVYLFDERVLEWEPLSLNQQMVADYLQAWQQDVVFGNQPVATPEQMAELNLRSQRFLYRVAVHDMMACYRSFLAEAAPVLERALAEAGVDSLREDLAETLREVREARSEDERRRAVRRVLDRLDFPQRRAVLHAARAIVPLPDPFPEHASPPADRPRATVRPGG